MYLKHFGLEEFPFSLTPDTQFFTKLPSHQEALNVLLIGLQNGEGFIKIVGEVGTGKTLLCRQLLRLLDDQYITAYIPNPNLSPKQLYIAVADELGIECELDEGTHFILKKITKRLVELHEQGKIVVLLLDEAQTLPEESLEAVRLLTNLETEKTRLLQVVLFGQPELDTKLDNASMRQLKQRITFSYQLQPLADNHLEFYLNHRMAVAGYEGMPLFKKHTLKQLGHASGGIPRLINVLCHKSLMVAFGLGERSIKPSHIKKAVEDTEAIASPQGVLSGWLPNKSIGWLGLGAGLVVIGAITVARLKLF